MDIRELTYLTVLAEEQSISRAAERLYMAQASLSQFLRQFEAQLGSPIFVRTSRGIRPTPAGDVFLAQARRILREYQQAQQEFWDHENTIGGTVYFGISSFRGAYILPRVLKTFYGTHPQASIRIYEGNSMELVPKVQSGALDLALSACPLSAAEGVQVEPLFDDEVLAVVTRDHPLMNYVRQAPDGRLWAPLADIARCECILSDKDTMLGHLVRRTAEDAGLTLRCRHDNITAAFAAAMARVGLAVAFTYRSCMIRQDDVAYVSLDEAGCYLHLALLFPGSEYRSRTTQAFAQLLRRQLGGAAAGQA